MAGKSQIPPAPGLQEGAGSIDSFDATKFRRFQLFDISAAFNLGSGQSCNIKSKLCYQNLRCVLFFSSVYRLVLQSHYRVSGQVLEKNFAVLQFNWDDGKVRQMYTAHVFNADLDGKLLVYGLILWKLVVSLTPHICIV